MAENKKSFILYSDQKEIFGQLTDEMAGKLIKHIFSYVNDEDPQSEDLIINLAFTPIRQQLKRDLKKWDTYIQKQSDNGKKGGRPKNQDKPKKPTAFLEKPSKPKKADNVNVNVNDINTPIWIEFRDYALEKKPNVNIKDLHLKYQSWEANGWKDGHDKPIKNWKSKLLNTLPFIKEATARPADEYAAHMKSILRA